VPAGSDRFLAAPGRAFELRGEALFVIPRVSRIQQAVFRPELADALEGKSLVTFARVEGFGRGHDGEILFHAAPVAGIEGNLGAEFRHAHRRQHVLPG